MAEKTLPKWYVDTIKKANTELLKETGKSWDELIEIWEEVIQICKKQRNEQSG